jgi:predicted phage tail protein
MFKKEWIAVILGTLLMAFGSFMLGEGRETPLSDIAIGDNMIVSGLALILGGVAIFVFPALIERLKKKEETVVVES